MRFFFQLQCFSVFVYCVSCFVDAEGKAGIFYRK